MRNEFFSPPAGDPLYLYIFFNLKKDILYYKALGPSIKADLLKTVYTNNNLTVYTWLVK
jgi:hypothetical protein